METAKQLQQQEEEQELALATDPVMEWTIHKEESPITANDEVTDEPENVEEDAIDTVNENEKSSYFPIEFYYRGESHVASVQKIEGILPEYLVTNIQPVVEHLPYPFVVAVHFSKEKFDFPINETFYPREFGIAVIKAITKACREKSMPVYE